MSKKLTGNGLWESSRMILPQHKEQSMPIQNSTPSPTFEPPTRKEIELMRDYIILPVALRIVEKKCIEVEMSSETLKLLYSTAAKILAKHIRYDAQKCKKALFEQNIRVFEDTVGDTELIYRYDCRGYKDHLVMTKDFMRTEISVRIGRYVRDLVTAMQKAAKNPVTP